MNFFDKIKQLTWKKLTIIGVSTVGGVFVFMALSHIFVQADRIAQNVQPLPSSSPTSTPAVDCPDRLEHDEESGPIWVKGEERRRITGEEEALIMASCFKANPVPTPIPTPSTKTTAKVSTKVATKTVESKPAPSPTSEVPKSDPSPSPTQTPTSQSTTGCQSNANPTFTYQLIAPSSVTNILPPPNLAQPSGDLKTHSYIDTPSSGIPLYAPIDMVLFKGDFYTGGPYYLDYRVSCEVTIRLAHVTDPPEVVKQAFGTDPDAAREIQIDPPISYQAGELIAYSGGPPWILNNGLDFGVYNTTKPNRYADSQTSKIYITAVCPYDYFTESLRNTYRAKFNLTTHQGMTPDGESFCQ